MHVRFVMKALATTKANGSGAARLVRQTNQQTESKLAVHRAP